MEWISIQEKYPEDNLDVLVLRKRGSCCIAYWVWNDTYLSFPGDLSGWKIPLNSVSIDDSEEQDLIFDINDVIYWMPLPKPPKD